MRRRFLALAAVLAILAGCSSASRHTASPSTSADGQADAAPNPDVIPPVITPAYVNAVFAVLNHISGDASRSLVASGTLTDQVRADLRSIYNDPLYSQEVEIESQSVAANLSNVRRPPGDVITTVVHLVSAAPVCIFVQTSADYRLVLKVPGPTPPSAYLGLRLKQAQDDPHDLNPTPWAIFFNAVYKSPTSVPDQCAG